MILRAVLVLCAGLAVMLAFQWWHAARLEESLTEMKRRAATAEAALAQQESALRTTRAHLQQVQKEADEYDAMRTALMEGDEDAPLPLWFRAYLARLLRPGSAD